MKSAHRHVPPVYPDALVVFSGHTEIRILRFLKRGFRHCFVAFNDTRNWITYDPLSHRTEIVVQPVTGDYDLAAYYRQRGLTVVSYPLPSVPARLAPWRPFTCVEAVKRALGLRAPWIFTPWQLFLYLRRCGADLVL